MEEEYKDIEIKEIIEKYENGVSLKTIAKLYKFPSIEVLREVLINYYKLEEQRKLPPEGIIPDKTKKEIFNLYKSGVSLNELENKFFISVYKIKNIIREFCDSSKLERTRAQNKSARLPVEEIIEELKNEKSLSYLSSKHSVSTTTIKKALKSYENGKEILENRTKGRKEIPIEEIADAYINDKMRELSEKYNVSDSTLRVRLIEKYGQQYNVILKADKEEKEREICEKFANLYENEGLSFVDIAKLHNISETTVKNKIKKYYSNKGIEKPKILKKNIFISYINNGKSIEEILCEAKKVNIHVPEVYITEYLNDKSEVNLDSIKISINKEFARLQEEGKKPNYLSPFNLANSLKSKGYGTKYQAVALLYKMIKDNNLSTDSILDIDNEEIVNAVYLLLNVRTNPGDERQNKIKDNELANIVFEAEIQYDNNENKSNIENELTF